MVWVYGGGYTFSYKGNDGDPSTIIKASQQSGDSDGVIYVAFNYRVGHLMFNFGFWLTQLREEPLVFSEDQTCSQTVAQTLVSSISGLHWTG